MSSADKSLWKNTAVYMEMAASTSTSADLSIHFNEERWAQAVTQAKWR